MDIQKIGIIGAGQMGGGIAHIAALAGYDVVMSDINSDQIARAMGVITKNMDRQVAKEKITANAKDAAVGRIAISEAVGDLAKCDMVIEAATENVDLKKSLFAALCKDLKKEAIIATNTSSISITMLANATDRPDKFVGTHFFNPVPMMKLVELIKGMATSDETFQTVSNFVTKIGKTPAIAEDFPGFIVNRILCPMINEAVYALYEGIGDVESIDLGMRLGANHPMGPLQLCDLIGLDTQLAVMEVLYNGFGDSKYRPCPLMYNYVNAGWLGRKTGKGFYDYSNKEAVPSR